MTPPDRAVLGALIAGGRARRLGGRPKGLLRLDGEALIDRLAALLAARCDRVIIVGDPAGPYAGRGLPVIADRLDAGAPGGVHTALCEAAEAAEAGDGWIWTLACDLPRLDGPTLDALWRRRAGHAALYRAAGRLQPLAALWHTAARPTFAAAFAAGRPGFDPLVAALDAAIVEAADPAPFANANTPADCRALGLDPDRFAG